MTTRQTVLHQYLLARLMGTVAIGMALAGQAQATLVVGYLTDKNNKPVPDAVLTAVPLNLPMPAAKPGETAEVAQEYYNFAPYVTVVRLGTAVRFPNRDANEHHLKSFSPAKPFELQVYGKGADPKPIVFDKLGEVALVCHLHDPMRGYIYVVDTPYFAKSDKAGNALLKDLPPGIYDMKVWAPTMLVGPPAQTVVVKANGSTNLKFQFDFVPKPAPVVFIPKTAPAAPDPKTSKPVKKAKAAEKSYAY